MQAIHYVYRDEDNNKLYTKVRIGDGENKALYWEREENGVIIKSIEGCRKVLYRLHYVLLGIQHGRTIFLVEGEKDVETLLPHGLIATTAPGSLEWPEEFTEKLESADVVILHDYDICGLKRRDLLCKALYGRVKRLRVVHLPGLEVREKHGQDITDWLAIGNTIQEFQTIVDETPDYVPNDNVNENKKGLCTVSVDELLRLNLPEREMLLSPFLPSQSLVLLVAKRGVGKTHIALGIAYAVATGGIFLKWSASKPRNVLYIDGEMPAVLMKERLLMLSNMSSVKPTAESLRLLTPDLQQQLMPDLSRKEGRDAIDPLLDGVDLIVIDNISCLFRSGGENEAESWQEAQEWALELRRRGKSVLFVHHAGKSGHQRGTSKREDILDAVILLKHPEDHKPEEGARFDIIFDKARHFSGESARPFQAHLLHENDSYYWKISGTAEEEQLIRMATMKKNGSTIQQIMEKENLTKAQVEGRIAKAREAHLLD